MNNKKVMSNLFWRFAERCGAQLVTFIVSIILARIIDPNVYGTIALMTVFITLVQVFVDSGLGTALVQKKDSDDLDFSSVFWANIILCLLLYGVLFFCAPLIASFYNDPEITGMLRVLSLVVVVSGVKNIQQAYISKHLLFKRFFFATLGGTICAAAVGIYLALNEAGAWALIVQNIINISIDTLIVWITVKWRPKFCFSFSRLKRLYSFGWKLLVSALLDTIYGKLRELLIGKVYTSSDLAYYNRGQKFPDLIVSNINTSINSVMLPVMSAEQDKLDQVRLITRRAIQVSFYCLTPLLIGLFFTADNLIAVLLGENWAECVPYLRIFCIVYTFYPVHTANLSAIKSLGRSDIFLKLEIVKKLLGLGLLALTVNVSVIAMTSVMLVSTVFNLCINSVFCKKLFGYRFGEQLLDILPSLLIALLMGAAVYFIDLFDINLILKLIIQVLVGAAVYIGISAASKNKSFGMLLNLIKEMRGRKNV